LSYTTQDSLKLFHGEGFSINTRKKEKMWIDYIEIERGDMNSLNIKIELNNCFKIEKMPIIKIEKTCLFVFYDKQDYIPFVYLFIVMIIFLLYLYFLYAN
jgi:hypothetical protein